MRIGIYYSFMVASLLLYTGCSTSVISQTAASLPSVEQNSSENHKSATISLFRLHNYTDTPRAGMRAANLAEGILLTKGYTIKSHINAKSVPFAKAQKLAQDDHSDYFMYGGVSEWRYKTGIDGEPAVSLQLSLYKTEDGSLVWSATGSDSDWGNGSIGTTAHDLLQEILITQ